MKNLFLAPITITLLCILGCTSCKKNVDPAPDNPYGLPNATQTGANIFACRINGQNFVAYNDIYRLAATITNDSLGVKGAPKLNDYYHAIYLQIKMAAKEGVIYDINSQNATATYVTDSTCSGLSFNIFSSNATSGSIQLTKLNTSNKTISGIFHLTFPMPNCDTLKITDGRFDIEYN